MSQYHFSQSLTSDFMNTCFFKRADYEILRKLVKELTFGQGEVQLKKLVNDMRHEVPAFQFPLTELNTDLFALGIVAVVAATHNFFAGKEYNPAAYRSRAFGCFSNREVLALSRLTDEYMGNGSLFRLLAVNGYYLVLDQSTAKQVYWWPTRYPRLSAEYAYTRVDNVIRSEYSSSAVNRYAFGRSANSGALKVTGYSE